MLSDQIPILEKELAELEILRRQIIHEIATLRRACDQFSPEQKVALFRSLFRGREDVYARWWQSDITGGRGYSPAKDFRGNHIEITNATIKNHLMGVDPCERPVNGRTRDFIVGIYPMQSDEKVWFLAADFDGDDWRDSAMHFVRTARAAGFAAYTEISRSGNGAHVWFFFDRSVTAAAARRLGFILLNRAIESRPEIGFFSYDRLFPNQDNLPRGGFGNLIALPLQHAARLRGTTVFVDDNWQPYADQWKFLADVQKISAICLNDFLDRNAADCEDWTVPWQMPKKHDLLDMKLPAEISLVLSDRIYIRRDNIPPRLATRIMRFAAFRNPEFYRAEKLRFSTYNKPRIISCGELMPQYIALPRGILADVTGFLTGHGVKVRTEDRRIMGVKIGARFTGELRPDQADVVKKICASGMGILSAPTAFGKTVAAISVIARRDCATLILVHRAQLATQWRARIKQFLDGADAGAIGGGKCRPTGRIDVATIQSLVRRDDLPEFMSQYGQLIVDECHHIAAFSFESVARAFRGKYVLGLTATLERKDGHHPIIMMQCGPVVANVSRKDADQDFAKILVPRHTDFYFAGNNGDMAIGDLYAAIMADAPRNRMICEDISAALAAGRACLVLSERRDHLNVFAEYFKGQAESMVILTGGMGRKDRAAVMKKLVEMPADVPLLILATGAYLGEGFDFARLDTLFLTMPISWRGKLAQYAGRLNRDFDGKKDVRIYDYIDTQIPMLMAMHRRRTAGYRALGFDWKRLPDCC